ncbi:MAG: imidazole glycerol phosphate synthase subunit HisH [Clostridia bacterium]|nr:imidazole glycerol phosphate synthase subunit HisH [Clostridia bacterium]
MIGLIDYGVGNLFSLVSSFRMIGEEAEIVRTPEEVARADKLILPGVGAFGDARAKLTQHGMDEAVLLAAGHGVPLLGICLGMQMLFETSEEFGYHAGLGLIPGRITAMQPRLPGDLKVPQIGWNALEMEPHPLFEGIPAGACVYFVHSYSAVDCDAWTIARTEYGIPVTAAVARDNVLGTQFHPEKSGRIGLAILSNFCRM